MDPPVRKDLHRQADQLPHLTDDLPPDRERLSHPTGLILAEDGFSTRDQGCG
jgi:hypothetical protein